MPVKVLFVSHTAELNGAERMLLHILRTLNRRDFDPSLVVPRKGPLQAEAEKAGSPTSEVPMKWWLTDGARAWKQPPAWLWNIRGVLRLKRLIAERGIDLVCSNSAAAVGGALAAHLARRPHVWIIHEVLTGRRPLLRFFLGNRLLAALIRRLSEAVAVNSLASLEAFRGDPRAEVVYNSLRIPAGRPKADPALGKRLGFGGRDRVVGLVGKIAPRKGQAELIRAAALAGRRVKGLKVLFVGAAPDGRYLAGLLREAGRLGIADRVAFSGYVEDVFGVLPLMDLLVSASAVESFGRAIIEAQSCGVPVLAVRTGGVPEVIRHGESGFLVGSNDPGVLAGAIEEFFGRKKADIERVTRNARWNVARRFSGEGQVRRLEAVFKRALREGRRGA